MISVIIPAYNQHEMTSDCINAVRLCTTGDYEIILVDNGSEPPIQKPYSGFVDTFLLRNEKNEGFPVAVNQGIRVAHGDSIVLLNNDVIVTQGALDRLDGWLHDGFDIIGPMTNFCAGMQRVVIPTYENTAELNLEAMAIAEESTGEHQDVNWLIGFCMAFKKSVFDDVGNFDESLWPCSGEEIDFCLRAKESGYRIGIALDTYVHHFGSKTFTDMETAGNIEYSKIVERNNKHLADKWGDDIWRRQAAISQSDGIRLNLGSGTFPLPGFINVDQYESVNPDLVCDITDLPYDSGAVTEIYAGHILEHFCFDDGMKALKYWYGLLCHGGIISIATPDFDHLTRKYLSDPSPRRLIDLCDTYIYSSNTISPHLFSYSPALLKKVMEDAGFVNLTVMPTNHPYFPHHVDWQIGYTGFKP